MPAEIQNLETLKDFFDDNLISLIIEQLQLYNTEKKSFKTT